MCCLTRLLRLKRPRPRLRRQRQASSGSLTPDLNSRPDKRRFKRQSGPPVLRPIDTRPAAFAVFDHVLLTVPPTDCSMRDAYAPGQLNASSAESRDAGVKLPTSPADLMLRVINLLVDVYLGLRRDLARQMDHWQSELLKPKARFHNWNSVLDARLAMHHLDEICEDQRSALQDWVDSIETWPEGATPALQRERVVHHVRRMEQSAETTVQMHFSVQSNRTNHIMRALAALFLPLNLITGFFGMNFEFMPIIHSFTGFWWPLACMVFLIVVAVLVLWRKRCLARKY